MSKPNAIQRNCESCKYWRVGDHSPKNIGNVGVCVWTLTRTQDFSSKPLHVPFWLDDTLRQTTSYEGQACPVWEKGSKILMKKNENRI